MLDYKKTPGKNLAKLNVDIVKMKKNEYYIVRNFQAKYCYSP